MIVSHKHRFIFLKTYKTAGTSIEVDLNKLLGDDDIATPIIPVVEGHTPKNFIHEERGLPIRKFYNHMPAREVRKFIGNTMFSEYFVFCVEREPVDKCISHFSMCKNSPTHNSKTKDLTIEEYIERRIFPVDTAMYTDSDGTLIVDRILRYENLTNELREIGMMFGFDFSLETKVKTGFRETITLDQSQKKLIYDAFSNSNKHTGYSL